MSRFAEPVFVAAGLRTSFGRGSGALANYDAVSLSVPVVQAMANLAEPDLAVWGTVIPNLGWSNIAREVWLDAKLNPSVLRCPSVLDQHDCNLRCGRTTWWRDRPDNGRRRRGHEQAVARLNR